MGKSKNRLTKNTAAPARKTHHLNPLIRGRVGTEPQASVAGRATERSTSPSWTTR